MHRCSGRLSLNIACLVMPAGMMLPHIRFFLGAWLLYSVLTVLWLGAYLRHYGDLLVLQHCITAAVIIGWLEMGGWYLDYSNFNHTG